MARNRGESRLEFRLLGSLEARYGEQPLRLGGAKPRALLAGLVLDLGRVVSVDRLVDAVWGEEAPATAAHAVKVNVSQLRKALEPAGASGIIVTQAPGYLLELDSEQVDVHRFQRLATRDAPRSATRIPRSPGCSCAKRSRCGVARRSRTSPTSRSRRRTSHASRSCGSS